MRKLANMRADSYSGVNYSYGRIGSNLDKKWRIRGTNKRNNGDTLILVVFGMFHINEDWVTGTWKD